MFPKKGWLLIMSNFNFDENTINKLKNMMNTGDLNDVISQIPPDMIKNFNSMISASNSANNETNSTNFSNASDTTNTQNTQNNSTQTNFNFNNLDMNTILKMKSILDKMNTSNDPRSNLLYSLKPYLRDSRKKKIDQYANLLNFAQVADLLKKDNNNNNDNKE